MSRRPPGLWQVLADHAGWTRPAVIATFASEADARDWARRMNAIYDDPGRPLYFVEHWETCNVLDVEHSIERPERGLADERG